MSNIFNFKVWLWSLLIISFGVNGSLNSQKNLLLESDFNLMDKGECLYTRYQHVLDSFILEKQQNHTAKIKSRNNNGNFELRIYVDTSFERRQTGSYNRNDSVLYILNKVIDSTKWMFNLAAPNWDINIETDILFFDGATPFSYGANLSETLINFYNWIDAHNYPGLDDDYVFYTGNYTNQGVSFLGALCFPGGSVVGFVSNFASNVDLASHEWIGHAANSQHYNNEVNIMNSIANRPWNAPSLNVIETYLDNQNCVVNTQAPLALTFEDFTLSLNENKVNLEWNFGEPNNVEYYIIERRCRSSEWKEIATCPIDQHYFDELLQNDTYYYRIQAILKDHSRIQSPMRAVNYKASAQVIIINSLLLNPECKLIQIFDFEGKLLYQTRESIIEIGRLNHIQNVLIHYDDKMMKCFLHD